MIIGVPAEIKAQEGRVGLVPAGVQQLVEHGHEVLVQADAGEGSGIPNDAFVRAGAKMIDGPEGVWSAAEMIVKVKEPIEQEYDLVREDQLIFTFFHLAAVPQLATLLTEKRVCAVAYETIETDTGQLPLLKPMSEVAGKMSVQQGTVCLERAVGGKGLLLGGVPGVRRGKVAIIGGGTVGTNAAKVAVGMGANVYVLDVSLDRLEYLDDIFQGRITTLYSDPHNIEEAVLEADLVIGAVLVAGAKAPQLVTRDHIARMHKGSVVVDVAVDQGGCIETCKPTTHDDPTYMVDGVVHYCVANMPGAVPHTSTLALTNATIAFTLALANAGIDEAAARDPRLARGVNTHRGHVTHRAVADSLELDFTPLDELLRP